MAATLVAALLMVACSAPRDPSEERTSIVHPVPVTVDVVRADPWPDTWEASGFVRRREPVTLTSRMAGVVKRVAVSKGQHVRAGDLLVAFDTSDLDSRPKEAKAAKLASPEAIRKAAEAVEMARLNLNTAKTEEAKKAARAAMDRELSAQAELRTQASGIDAARQAEDAVRDAAVMTAPTGGRITELFAVTGKLLAKDAPLLGFEPDGSYFETSMETLKLGGAEVGSTVTVSMGKNCEGAAQIVEITDSPLDGHKDVRTSMPPCKEPRADARGRIRFEGPAHPAVTVAPGAVITRNGRTSVFLVEDGLAKLRRITIGERRANRVEVIAGLAPGSKVVLQPEATLKDNAPVVFSEQK
jgi:RND family efflux transporter MFP subunit